MRRFVGEWLRLLLLGDSWLDKVWRMVSLLVALGFAAILQQSITLTFESGGDVAFKQTFPLGWLILVVLVTFYVAVTAGAAWVLPRGPRLWMSDELEPDTTYMMFRLRLKNVGVGIAKPQVYIDRIEGERGSVLKEVLLPIELQWSHEQDELPAGISGTVGVAMVRYPEVIPRGDPFLVITGKGYDLPVDEDIPWQNRRPLFFYLRTVETSAAQALNRCFRIEPEFSALLHYKVTASKPAVPKG